MRSKLTFRQAALRVVQRPVPWVLRYAGSAIPAFLLALALVFPLRAWLSYPLVAEALETRSLDLLVDALMALSGGLSEGPLLLSGLVLVPLVWVGLRLLWLLLEGGVLVTYAQPARPAAREFLSACVTWFPSFLLVAFVTVLAVGAVIAITVIGIVLADALSLGTWVTATVTVAGVAGVVTVRAIGNLARAVAVVARDGNVLRAIGGAARAAAWQFRSAVALVLGTLLLQGLLFSLQRLFSGWIPQSWWLLTLLVQQAIRIAMTGVGLARRAGEVVLASALVSPSPEAIAPG